MTFKIKHIPAFSIFLILAFGSITVPLLALENKMQTYDIKIIHNKNQKQDILHYIIEGEGLLEKLTDVAKAHNATLKTDNTGDDNIPKHTFYAPTKAAFRALNKKIGEHELDLFGIDHSVKAQQKGFGDLLNVDLKIIDRDNAIRSFSILTTNKNWSGFRYDNINIRMYPSLKDDEVFVMMNISEIKDGKIVKSVTPSLITGLSEEATIGMGGPADQAMPSEIKFTFTRVSS